jgi:HAD superfamily hydrolase (TIGR01509 family)
MVEDGSAEGKAVFCGRRGAGFMRAPLHEAMCPPLAQNGDTVVSSFCAGGGGETLGLYRNLVIAEGVELLPSVTEFLQRLRDAGVLCAIGSSTHWANIESVFAITGLARYFPHVVSAEDVCVGKPDPEVILLGAKKIGREPACCIVFADALPGQQAAQAGGRHAVAVAAAHLVTGLEPWVDRVVRRLDELSVADLEAIMCSERGR